MVAVEDPAVVIDHDQAIGITVKGDTQIRSQFPHCLSQEIRVSGSTININVNAIGPVIYD